MRDKRAREPTRQPRQESLRDNRDKRAYETTETREPTRQPRQESMQHAIKQGLKHSLKQGLKHSLKQGLKHSLKKRSNKHTCETARETAREISERDKLTRPRVSPPHKGDLSFEETRNISRTSNN